MGEGGGEKREERGEREEGEGGGEEGRRHYHITSKATATLKVAKLCNFHFHNLSQFPALCLTMARVHDAHNLSQFPALCLIMATVHDAVISSQIK